LIESDEKDFGLHLYLEITPREQEEVTAKERNDVAKLQVILRPSPSTRGRGNQQRLFLRILSRKELLSDVCLDHPFLLPEHAKSGGWIVIWTPWF
jgi:hypothetical protein